MRFLKAVALGLPRAALVCLICLALSPVAVVALAACLGGDSRLLDRLPDPPFGLGGS